jgi:hypothetical protein
MYFKKIISARYLQKVVCMSICFLILRSKIKKQILMHQTCREDSARWEKEPFCALATSLISCNSKSRNPSGKTYKNHTFGAAF